MTHLNDIEQYIKRENDGSINYEYYTSRANKIRSKSILGLFIRLFTNKNNSSLSGSKNKKLNIDVRRMEERFVKWVVQFKPKNRWLEMD